MAEISRLDEILCAICNGGSVDCKPLSRNEEYLLALLKGEKVDKKPITRIEAYLSNLCNNGAGGGGEAEKYDGSVTIE